MAGVTFTEVPPEELESTVDTRRGRVSYPIIKGFMETGLYIARVNFEDSMRKAPNMYVLLKSFVSNHDLPIKVLLRKNRLYLLRLDIDKDGNKIEDWKEKNFPKENVDDEAAEPIDKLLEDIE